MYFSKIDIFFNKIPDILIIIFSSLIPICLMVFWHSNNHSLPISDANDFIGTAGKITNFFYNGEFFEGMKSLYSEKPWRPLSFHLFLFPFMLISNNNILFTTICVHSVCLFFIIFYAYLIFIRNCDSKIICFFGSAFIGLLSSSFFPGGMIMFAETAFTPAIIATLYHLYYSEYLCVKRQSILFLIALLIAVTVRPIEAILYLAPVLSYFFYTGYKKEIFSFNLILNILKTLTISIFILSLRGLDLEIDGRLKQIGDPDAIKLYEFLFNFLIILIIFIFLPFFIKRIKEYIFFIRSSYDIYKSYALFIFTIFSFILLVWFYDAWRDLFIWVYRTQFGDIASNSENFIIPSLSVNSIFAGLYSHLSFGGIFPIIFILSISIFCYFIKIRNNISIDTKIHWYLILPIVVPLITTLITISNTPRKFALIYILFVIFCYVYIISIKKLKGILLILISTFVVIQTFTIFSVANDKPLSFSKYVIGHAIILPKKTNPLEKKISKEIHKLSLTNKFKKVSLTWTHPMINIDIFSTAMLLNLNAKKSYSVYLPVFFKNYDKKEIYKRLKSRDALFIVNPSGDMKFSEKKASEYKKKYFESVKPQELFYNKLLYLYFSKKLQDNYDFKSVSCMDLSTKIHAREGCLLVKTKK